MLHCSWKKCLSSVSNKAVSIHDTNPIDKFINWLFQGGLEVIYLHVVYLLWLPLCCSSKLWFWLMLATLLRKSWSSCSHAHCKFFCAVLSFSPGVWVRIFYFIISIPQPFILNVKSEIFTIVLQAFYFSIKNRLSISQSLVSSWIGEWVLMHSTFSLWKFLLSNHICEN